MFTPSGGQKQKLLPQSYQNDCLQIEWNGVLKSQLLLYAESGRDDTHIHTYKV
jgi:hypothetical protein